MGSCQQMLLHWTRRDGKPAELVTDWSLEKPLGVDGTFYSRHRWPADVPIYRICQYLLKRFHES